MISAWIFIWISMDIIGSILDNIDGYFLDISSGYSIWIIMDILGYLLDKYTWIPLMDMLLGYVWISLGYLLDIIRG